MSIDNFMLFCPKGLQSNILRKLQKAFHFSLPIGVFWDIETCGVPIGKSAFALAQNIRKKFLEHHREVEFVCVCDVKKQSRNVIEELIFAQVTVVHVSGIKKNEASDKLKQYMKRIVVVDKQNGTPSTLLLISENVDFSSELSDFRHRDKTRVILIHRGRAHQSLLACADEHYKFSAIESDVPSQISSKLPDTRLNLLLVTNWPINLNTGKIICILKKLSRDCGGRVFKVMGKYKAVIHFPTLDAAVKAQKQMHKQCVHGKEISVTFYCGIGPDIIASPFKRNKIQTSSINSRSKWSSYSTRKGKETFKTHTSGLSCSKFDFPRIIPLMYNRTDNLNELILSFVSTGFEEPFVHTLRHPENLPFDIKPSVNENFDSISFETQPVCGLDCARTSLLGSKDTEKKLTFANHAQGLVTSAGKRSLKTIELQNSFSKSSAHIIPTSEIPSEFSQNSPLVSSDKNRNFNSEGEIPICTKKDNSKKCFPNDLSKFEMKQGTNFEKSPIGLLEVSRPQRKDSHPVQPAHRHLNLSTECKDSDHVQVEIIKSALNERKQGRRIRIAARFTNPIDD